MLVKHVTRTALFSLSHQMLATEVINGAPSSFNGEGSKVWQSI